jgi:NAD(P)-dependent dehydrogenase (short-subunit alcohol dehydrogenase family)
VNLGTNTHELQLASKAVLVTGAASGIGAAVVARLVECGANVVAFDRDRAASPSAAKQVVAQVGDLTRQSDVDAAIALATTSFGRLDAVVNCAGVTDDGVVWKLTDAQWQRVLDVNLTGSFRVVRAAVPVMRAGGGGSIVLVSSVNGLRGKFGQSNYAASKAGVVALAKSVAQETGSFQIRVNAVAPGYVKTPMTAKIPPKFVEQALSETPLGRLAEPEDVADAILFLCSPLSRHVTGTVLRVDGGQVTGA